jgi:hypothetical protein
VRIGVFGLFFIVWFLAADAYWMSKERDVAKCKLTSTIELVKHTLPDHYFDKPMDNEMTLINAMYAVAKKCSWVIGAGNYWDSPQGMAYWELLLLTPVITRFRFE